MKCFYHRTDDAVAICKSCSRALCSGCAAEVEDGIACRGRCEENARLLSRLVSRSKRLTPMAGTPYLVLGLFLLILGLLSLVRGVTLEEEGRVNFVSVGGGVESVVGAYFLLLALRIRRA